MSHSFTASQLISDYSLILQLGIWSHDRQDLEGRQERIHKILVLNHCVVSLFLPFSNSKMFREIRLGQGEVLLTPFSSRTLFCSHLVSSAANARWDYPINRIDTLLPEWARNLARTAKSFHAKLNSESPVPVVLRKTGQYTLKVIFTDVLCTVTQLICFLCKSFFCWGFLESDVFVCLVGFLFGLGCFFFFSPECAKLEMHLIKIASF